MKKNKQEKQQYGTFAFNKSRNFGLKKILLLSVIVVILILGTAGVLFKHFNNNKKVAETKTEDPIPGWWYKQYFGNSVCERDICQPNSDPDQDKLTNVQEFYYHSNPLNSHTVGDALDDGEMVAQGFDPSKKERTTFEEAATPENLLGESLVFDSDIKTMVNEENDISKIALPLVEDDKLQVVYAENQNVFMTYSTKLKTAFNRYFPQQNMQNITEIIKSGNESEIYDVKDNAKDLSDELRTIPVPVRFLMFHKYNVAMFQLLSEILPPPINPTEQVGDAWYDKVQEFLAVQQKLNFEERALRQVPIK